MEVDFLVVGAGLAGCVIAERAATVLKKNVLIVEKRNHIAGNTYDYDDENGISIHKYGPHFFHTNNKEVWGYLGNFTDWHIYFHKAKAFIDGIETIIPFNLNSIYQVFPPSLASKLEAKLIENFGFNTKVSILKLKEHEDKDLKFLSDYIYNKVFLGYTLKQWGLTPEQLDESVTARIPVYISRDDRYFQDKYQAIPASGYTKMVENILKNDRINVKLNTDFKEMKDKVSYKHLIYTGPVDEYFDFKHGHLPYRSLSFQFKTLDMDFYKTTGTTNYPENFDFTRITEFKHCLPAKTSKTSIAIEYPEPYIQDKNEPYYPIPNDENSAKYQLYRQEAQHLSNVTFVGRLAEYKYYNMDQVVESALNIFNTDIVKRNY